MRRSWADTRVRTYISTHGRFFLDVFEPLLEEADDVVVVGDVVDVAADPARFHEPHAAQQAQLMGDRGLGESQEAGEVADRHLGPGEGVENAHARGVAEHLEGLGQRGDGRLVEEARPQLNI